MAQEKSSLFVGIDVGGTNITTLLVEGAGRVVARNRGRTPRKGGAETTLAAIVKTVEALLSKADAEPGDLTAIGLAVAGVVDSDKGLVVVTPNMNLSGLHIVEPMEEKFGVPVALGNDVDMGTLGETWLGAARGASSVVGIFVGTGIGGGVIMGGRLARRPHGGRRDRPHRHAARRPALRLRLPRLLRGPGQPHRHRARHPRGRRGRPGEHRHRAAQGRPVQTHQERHAEEGPQEGRRRS